MTRLRRVRRIHRFDANPLLGRLIAELRVHLYESPSVEPSVHERTVVHVLADMGEVFEDQNGVPEVVSVGEASEVIVVEDVTDIRERLP